MHGTIIHYDSLTQCGLLRTAGGQIQYFRHDEVSSKGPVVTGQPVALRTGVPVDTGGSQFDEKWPPPPMPVPHRVAITTPTADQVWAGWVGSGLSLVALVLLVLSGGEGSLYASPTPRLIDSFFGTVAAALLVIEILFFLPSLSSKRRLRWTFWLVAWSTVFAYVGQLVNGFESDTASHWYAYALVALGFAVYILPYRSK